MALLLGLGATALFLLGTAGFRMMRTTGLEQVDGAVIAPAVVANDPETEFGLLDRIGSRFTGALLRAYGMPRLRRLDERIRRAGRPDRITVTIYIRRQAAFLVLSIATLVVFSLLGQPLIGALFAALFAAWMPLWLHQVSRSRQARIDADLPDFLDVLGVTVSAGMSFRQAVERVCDFHTGPLAEEMTTALHEMTLGVPRREAFVSLRDRNSSEGVGTFVTALLQAEELGVPLANALADIARDVRQGHAQQVRQSAAKASPKISLVVTATIVPGTLILVFSAVILANREMLSALF